MQAGKKRMVSLRIALLVASILMVLCIPDVNAQSNRSRDTFKSQPTFKIVVPQVQMVQPDAEVSVTVGQAAVAKEQGASTGKVEGDLGAVAMSVLRSRLYIAAPNVNVSTRGLAGVQMVAAATQGATAAPTPSSASTWLYDLRIDSFKEFRDKEGRRGTAIDAVLYISDEHGKAIKSIEYHEPPLAQRKTDEDIAKEIQRLKEGQAIMGAFSGTFMGAVVDMAQKDAELKQQQILNNYQYSQNPNLNDYQFQESAVRKAVEKIVSQMPLPGERPSLEVSVKLENPRLRREPTVQFEEGVALLQQSLYDEAIAIWTELEPDNPALQFNIGLAHLANASKYVAKQPATAYAKAKEAAVLFAKASKKTKNETVTNATRQMLENIESYYGGPPPEGQELATFRRADTQPAEAPPLAAIGEKYALLIGVGKFANSNISPLGAPPRDVRLLEESLTAAGFKPGNVITLVDEQATLRGIRLALEQLATKVTPESLVVIAISTHGTNPMTQDIGNEGYILCHDSNPQELFATAYPVLDFREHIDRRLRCQAKVVFQDTCHGAAGNTRFAGTQFKFTEWPRYMAIFAASGVEQPSIEIPGKNGVFTAAVSEFIKKGTNQITVAMLRDHVVSEVPKIAQTYGYAQTPQVYLGPGAETILLK